MRTATCRCDHLWWLLRTIFATIWAGHAERLGHAGAERKNQSPPGAAAPHAEGEHGTGWSLRPLPGRGAQLVQMTLEEAAPDAAPSSTSSGPARTPG